MTTEKTSSIKAQIKEYLDSQPDSKRTELQMLHKRILKISTEVKLWFSDGKNGIGKVVANPSIGYGAYTIHYKDGSNREFYRIGLSANTTGISVYVMGISDKTYLTKAFGKTIGKASVTGYCIKFKRVSDIDIDVLEEAIHYGLSL